MSNYGTNFIDQATLRNTILKHASMGQIVHLVQVYVMCLLKTLPLRYPSSFYFLECLFFTSKYRYNDAWPLHMYINCVRYTIRYGKPKNIVTRKFCSYLKLQKFIQQSVHCSKHLRVYLHSQLIFCTNLIIKVTLCG